MKQLRTNNQGYSPMAVVLAVVIIGLLIVLGVLIYNHKSNNTTNNTVKTLSQSKGTTAQSATTAKTNLNISRN